jgi:hypothetical protein
MGWCGRGYEQFLLHTSSGNSWRFEETRCQKLISSGMSPFCSGSVLSSGSSSQEPLVKQKSSHPWGLNLQQHFSETVKPQYYHLNMLWHCSASSISCFIPISLRQSLKSVLQVRPSCRTSASLACAAVQLLLSTPIPPATCHTKSHSFSCEFQLETDIHELNSEDLLE